MLILHYIDNLDTLSCWRTMVTWLREIQSGIPISGELIREDRKFKGSLGNLMRPLSQNIESTPLICEQAEDI